MRDLDGNEVDMRDLLENNVDQKPPKDDGSVRASHRIAEYNYAIKTFKIPDSAVPLPKLFDIYFHPDRCVVPVAPGDLQLGVYFSSYNTIARDGFVAQKTQHINIIRTIWFYGLDCAHAFTMYSRHIRWNVIIMSFLWATDFNERYCKRGCGPFVIQFIKAWMESLVYQHDISDNCFVEREAFIKFWRNGPFDLYYFGKSDQKKMAGRIAYLHKQLETVDLPKHDDIVQAMRGGKVNEEKFKKYGAVLALQWVMGREQRAREEQEEVDRENELNQSELELAEADREIAEAEKQVELTAAALQNLDEMEEDDEEEEEEDGFDPFPKEYHPRLSTVPWDDIDGIVLPLLMSVDATLPHPKKVREQDRPKPHEDTFYITKAQVFQGVFRVTEGVDEELGEGMLMLTSMMHTKLD